MSLARVATFATGLVVGIEGMRMKKDRVRSCGAKGPSTADELNMSIVNGQPATECEWKWQVGLVDMGGTDPWCGGTLISEEWVLSAAHCMGSQFQVIAGDWNSASESGKEQRRTAVEVYSHPDYSSNPTSSDYALIKVDPPFDLNDCVGTACLPAVDVVGGEECYITGWGTLRSGGSSPDILQEAKVSIISNADCTGEFGYSPNDIDDSMICAQGRSASGGITDACQGDSGGPLVCKNGNTWEIQGATSWGRGCAGANYPGVWARVYYVMGWIEATMAGESVPDPTAPPPFQCNNGCYINPDYVNDAFCDCTSCEDEDSYTCQTCGNGCPTVCGAYESC